MITKAIISTTWTFSLITFISACEGESRNSGDTAGESPPYTPPIDVIDDITDIEPNVSRDKQCFDFRSEFYDWTEEGRTIFTQAVAQCVREGLGQNECTVKNMNELAQRFAEEIYLDESEKSVAIDAAHCYFSEMQFPEGYPWYLKDYVQASFSCRCDLPEPSSRFDFGAGLGW